jgi:Galactose oxidase, central domain
MSELEFDIRLGVQLRAYADGGVRPIDRYAIAESIVVGASLRRPASRIGRVWRGGKHPARRTTLVVAATVLLLALLGGTLMLSVGHAPAPLPTPPTTSHSPTTSTYKGVFRLLAPLADGGSPDTAIALADGRVLQLGGGADYRSASIADPTTGRFIATKGKLNARRSQPTAVLLEDGRVLVIGSDLTEEVAGTSTITASTAEIYDPATDVFTKTGPMQTSTWIQGSVRLADGRVLVSGGGPPGDDTLALATAEIFDPRSATFSSTGSMTSPRLGHTLVLLADGRVLATGGRSDPRVDASPVTGDLYDPRRGTWSATGPMSGIPAPALPSRFPLFARSPAVALQDGRALVPGLACQEVHVVRSNGTSDGFDPTPTEIFDPATGMFAPGGPMPHCVSSAIPLPDGEVLVTGWWYTGTEESWSGLFDPATGRVRETAPAPPGPYVEIVPLPDGRVLFFSPGAGLKVFE